MYEGPAPDEVASTKQGSPQANVAMFFAEAQAADWEPAEHSTLMWEDQPKLTYSDAARGDRTAGEDVKLAWFNHAKKPGSF